jgi:hypothetical protein
MFKVALGVPRSMRVITLNVWNRSGAWPDRRDVLAEGLRRLNPDLLTLQETVVIDGYDQVADLIGHDYTIVHQGGRTPDGVGAAIASRWPVTRMHYGTGPPHRLHPRPQWHTQAHARDRPLRPDLRRARPRGLGRRSLRPGRRLQPAASGSRTEKVTPPPGVGRWPTVPPCAATSAFTIDRPRPEPADGDRSWSRARAGSTR